MNNRTLGISKGKIISDAESEANKETTKSDEFEFNPGFSQRYRGRIPALNEMPKEIIVEIIKQAPGREGTKMKCRLSNVRKEFNIFFKNDLLFDKFLFNSEKRKQFTNLFLEVIDNELYTVRTRLTQDPLLLMVGLALSYKKIKLGVSSKYTWQRFIVEDPLMAAVRRKQLEMIKILLPFYDKIINSQSKDHIPYRENILKAKKDALSKWSILCSKTSSDIIIPEKYKEDLQLLLELFLTETFPNGTDVSNFEKKLSNKTETQLISFREQAFPQSELCLYQFYKISLENFNKFKSNDHRLHFLVKVGSWIQSKLPSEIMEVLCGIERDPIHLQLSHSSDIMLPAYYRTIPDSLSYFSAATKLWSLRRLYLFGSYDNNGLLIITEQSIIKAFERLNQYLWKREKEFLQILQPQQTQTSSVTIRKW